MKKQSVKILFGIVAVLMLTQQVWAASSISTRVKVVEEKIRLHDKKLRALAAQQELTNKQVEALKSARAEAEKAMEAKAEAAKKAASIRLAALKAKQQQEVLASKEANKSTTNVSLHSDPASYAFP